jgi:hypothetical protein
MVEVGFQRVEVRNSPMLKSLKKGRELIISR